MLPTLKTFTTVTDSDTFLRKHRRDERSFTRQRKLPFATVLTLLLRKSVKSLQRVLNEWSRDADEYISASGLSQARQKFRYTAFIELLEECVVKPLYKDRGHKGIVELVELAEGETVHFEGCHITPVQLALPNMYAFLIETSEGSRTILAPDELYQWQHPDHLHSAELAIFQIGLFEFDPFTGARRLPEGFLERLGEMTFNMTIELVKQLRAKRVIILHLEEPEGMSYPRYQELEGLFAPLDLNVSFAYDMQRIIL